MDKGQQEKVNLILLNVVGMRLYRVYRADTMPCVAFARDGSTNENGDFHLHAQCPVRVTKDGVTLLAVNDMFLPRSGISERKFQRERNKLPLSRYDECAEKLEQSACTVIGASCSPDGDLRFELSDGSQMIAFPIGSTEDEEWRIIDKDGKRHTAYSGNGALDVDDQTE